MTSPARTSTPERHQMYINGRWTDSSTGAWQESVDPYNAEAWAEVPSGDATDIDRAVKAARAAFDDGPWAKASGIERARLMRRLATLVNDRADDLAFAEVRDNGKLLREMSGQVRDLPNWYDFFAGAADKMGGNVIQSSKQNFLVYTVDEPVGVVGAITPWNSPLLLLSFKLAPALATGCTFVLKPASETPVSALLFARLVDEAGFPPGVFNVVTGRGSTAGEALVEHPGVNKVAFTGSTEVGIRVAERAAHRLAPVSLELGGKSPNIVFEDADLDAAANGAIAGIFGAAGQTCVAGSRLLVQRSIHESFVERVVARARDIVLGDPLEPRTEMGPIAFASHQERVLEYVSIGQAEGAQLAVGGSRRPDLGPGFFVEPTIFTGVDNQMRIAREEIFGPVLSVISFDDEEDAVKIANDTPNGLAAGVWTRDLARAHRTVRRLQAGTVWVNAYRVLNFDVPFGGMKLSGHGRENGLEAMRGYVHTKAAWIELTGAPRDPFRLG